jgi:phage terminase large subunit-like protein
LTETIELLPDATNAEPMARFAAYIEAVRSGEIVACRYVRQAVDRHVRDMESGGERGLWFDADEADASIRFIECLKHSKGEWAGSNLHLEPWQCFIIGSIFGWKNSDGTRRFRIAYEEVARKNGKSTTAAGIGLKLFIFDDEPGAEVYTAATKRDQAKIVHEEAKRMVRKSVLRDVVTILRDNMLYGDSIYRPLGADADTLDGLHLHGAIVDEMHAHKTRDLYDVLDTATGSRRQSMLFIITTAGEGGDRESICWELRSYTTKVLDGIIEDDTWFGVIFTLDDGDDWTDETTWIKANPNLGVSVSLDDLKRKCKKAQETPASQNNFRRKHTNEWVESDQAWLPAGLWDSNAGGAWYDDAGLKQEIRDRLRGRPCWIGGDLSSVDDLTGIVAVFPADDGFYDVIPFGWCPRENAIGRERDHRVPYTAWAARGQIFLTEGNSVDYDAVRALLCRMRDEWQWDIQEINMDPHNARYVFTKLVDEDQFPETVVLEHRQGYISMNDPIKQTQKLLLDGKLRHGGHRPLAWCVSNVVTRVDPAGNIKFDKARAAEKIDLAVALVMAAGRAVSRPDETSVYERRGLLSV